MSNDLCFLSATELRERITSKKVSPVEIVSAVLARAEALQPELNCFITLCGDEAMAAARAAERKVMAGEPLGLLHGLPVTVKDIVITKGVKTTFGAVPYKDNVPTEDAIAVAKLRAEGAILIGKTTTPEFGSKCLTDSPLFGRTRNAWSAERSSGGSSGGAAVAVASGIAPLAIATDGGGSTRIPAACNGVVGLKQSNGVIAHSQALDAFGNQTYVTPATRTVADTALMMQAMAGEDACDPWSIGVPVPDFIGAAAPRGDLRGQKILFCASPPGRPVSADVATAFKASGAPSTTPSGVRAFRSWWRSIVMSSARLSSSRSRWQPMSAALTTRRRCSRARRCSVACNRCWRMGIFWRCRPSPALRYRSTRTCSALSRSTGRISTASGRTGSPGPCRST